MQIQTSLVLALTLALPVAAWADAPVWNATLRYRLETVDDAAFVHDAVANTVRLRIDVRIPIRSGFAAVVGGEGVAELGDHFNSGANGATRYPVVADPRAVEINQAYLTWSNPHARANVGRQRILLDNQRFIGNSGWRQNEQTFDAVLLEATPRKDLTLRYLWLDRVHRVAGDHARDPLARERNLDAHLVQYAWAAPLGQVVGYHYRIEDQDVVAASTATSGARWHGDRPQAQHPWGWTAEWARQTEAGGNPARFSHHYALLEARLMPNAALGFKAGIERLGGDGQHALQSPLATLHAFNGWADMFLTTPVTGLADAYLGANGKLRGFDWAVTGHDFDATRGGTHYGREWDASLGRGFGHGWSGLIKFADFNRIDAARDVRKLWLQVEWQH